MVHAWMKAKETQSECEVMKARLVPMQSRKVGAWMAGMVYESPPSRP